MMGYFVQYKVVLILAYLNAYRHNDAPGLHISKLSPHLQLHDLLPQRAIPRLFSGA